MSDARVRVQHTQEYKLEVVRQVRVGLLAQTESLWGRLKTACLCGRKFAMRRNATDAVLDWMTFCNQRRLHSTLGFSTAWRVGALTKWVSDAP